jgi:hypothetical protein
MCPHLVMAEEEKAVPPTEWKPAGQIMPPSPTAGVDAEADLPSPMVQYGEFKLNLHGRIQVMGGLVGEDSHVSNGDVLNRDGFRIRRARLGLDGQVVDKWNYNLELDLIDEDSGGNALLEALITYQASEYSWINVGVTKLPFSRLLMVSSGNMQLIERPAWVNIEAATRTNVLDPGRQVGLSVGGSLSIFDYSVGIYNGSTGFSVGDLNDGLMYVMRFGAGQGEISKSEADFSGKGLRWHLGLNGYLNQAAAADIRAAGADLAIKFRGLSFFAEAVWAKVLPSAQPESTNSFVDVSERWGMAAQAGYLLPLCFGGLEMVARFAMMDENVHIKDEGDIWELTAGLNAYFKEDNIKLMLNYVLRQEIEGSSLDNDAILAVMQLMF